FNEVTWFYPIGSGPTDITHYATFNYVEGVWYTGTMARGAWMPALTKKQPIASSITGDLENYLYYHETGHSGDGEPINAYIESGDLELADGQSFVFVRRLLPDFEFSGTAAAANVQVSIKGRRYPLEE